MQGVFLESEPDVGVEFPGPLEAVFVEIEHEQAASRAQDAEGLVDRRLRVRGVVQRLAEDGEIHRTVAQGHVLDVAEPVREVRQAVAPRQGRTDLDHPGGVVDAPDLLGATGEEL